MVQFNPFLGNKGIIRFPKSVSSKMNLIARLQFEIANYDIGVEHVSHNATWIRGFPLFTLDW